MMIVDTDWTDDDDLTDEQLLRDRGYEWVDGMTVYDLIKYAARERHGE